MAGKQSAHVSMKVLASRHEASLCLAEVGEIERELQAVSDRAAARIAEIKAEADKSASVCRKKIARRVEAMYAYFDEHRGGETDTEKTMFLASGTIGERKAPYSAHVSSIEKAVRELLKRGLKQFVRTTEEVDKATILSTPENRELVKGIPGIRVDQKDIFYAKPMDLKNEITRDIKKLRRRIA